MNFEVRHKTKTTRKFFYLNVIKQIAISFSLVFNMAKEESKQPKEITEILDEQIETSLHEHRRSRFSLLLSSFSAGLEVGFSLLLMAAAYSMFAETSSDNFMQVLIAVCYPLGFIFVIIGRSELFTEHTTLAIFPVLNGDETIKNLFILKKNPDELLMATYCRYAGNIGCYTTNINSVNPNLLNSTKLREFYSENTIKKYILGY